MPAFAADCGPACRAVYGSRDLPAEAVGRDAYVLRVLEQLRAALRRRDVFAASSPWRAGPRAMLRDGVGGGQTGDPHRPGTGHACREHPRDLARSLDGQWREMAQRLAGAGPKAGVQIVSAAERRVRLPVARLDAGRRAGLTQGSSARWWRRCCRGPARRACCLQVHARTCCLDACTHAAGPLVLRAGPVSVAALLVAGARSVGPTPVVKPGVPALTRDRLLSAGGAASCGRHTGKARKPGVLGLVLNAAVLWNIGYIDAAVAALRPPATRSAGQDQGYDHR